MQQLIILILIIFSISSCRNKPSIDKKVNKLDPIVRVWQDNYNIKAEKIILTGGRPSYAILKLYDGQSIDTLPASLLALEISELYEKVDVVSIESGPDLYFDFGFYSSILHFVNNKIDITREFLINPKSREKIHLSENITSNEASVLFSAVDSLKTNIEFIGFGFWNEFPSKNEILSIVELNYKINPKDTVTISYECHNNPENIYGIGLK